jgi:putative transcriptional regulator
MENDRLCNSMKLHRTRAGLTQGQLADMVDVTRKTVNSVENGVFVPSAVLALKLARALQTPLETLFFLPDE